LAYAFRVMISRPSFSFEEIIFEAHRPIKGGFAEQGGVEIILNWAVNTEFCELSCETDVIRTAI
jgi:hypothetical protein